MTAYCPERAAAHARKTVADEGCVEHDPRLVEAVARAVQPELSRIELLNCSPQQLDHLRAMRCARAALDAIARFEREEG